MILPLRNFNFNASFTKIKRGVKPQNFSGSTTDAVLLVLRRMAFNRMVTYTGCACIAQTDGNCTSNFIFGWIVSETRTEEDKKIFGKNYGCMFSQPSEGVWGQPPLLPPAMLCLYYCVTDRTQLSTKHIELWVFRLGIRQLFFL